MPVSRFVVLIVVFAACGASAQQQPTPPRRVTLNGVAVDDIRAVTLIDMKVTIDVHGNIQLFNPAYKVERRPGLPAQIVRSPRVPTQPTRAMVFLVSETQGVPIFDLRITVGGRIAGTISSSSPRTTLDLSRLFGVGTNTLTFEAVPVVRPGATAAGKHRVTLGYGQPEGHTLAIEQVLLRYERDGKARAPVEQRQVVLDR